MMSKSRKAMEHRRMQAAADIQAGAYASQIARKYGVSRATGSRWCRAVTENGPDSLRLRTAPGRPRRVPLVELRELYESNDWTASGFVKAIQKRFGVRYSEDHVYRIIHKLRAH